MKIRSFTALTAAVILGFASVVHGAEQKIGLVDLRKVFDGYHRTQEADKKIKDEAETLKRNTESMLEDYKKANDEYKQVIDAANDSALSAEEKQKRQKAAQDKLADIKQLENQIRSVGESSRAALAEKQRRMRDQILKEIREVVVMKSKAAGFTLVLDSAADSVNQTPVVLFTNGENDLTAEVIKQLNANSPTTPITGAADKAEKSEKK